MAYNTVVETTKQVVRRHPDFGPIVGAVRTEKRAHGRRIKFALVGHRPRLIKLAGLEDELKQAGIRLLGADFQFVQDTFGTHGRHFLVLHIQLDN